MARSKGGGNPINPAVEGHRAAFDLAGGWAKAKHGVAGDGLAEPDSPRPQRFLFVDGEADVVHRPGRACSGMKIGFQILYASKLISLWRLTPRASRSRRREN